MVPKSVKLCLSYLGRRWEYVTAIFIAMYFIAFRVWGGEMSAVAGGNLMVPIRQPTLELIEFWGNHGGQGNLKRIAYVLSGVDIESLNLAVINLMRLQRSGSAVRSYVVLVDESLRDLDTKRYIQLRKVASDNGIRIKTISVESPTEVELHVFGLTEYTRVVYIAPQTLTLGKGNHPTRDLKKPDDPFGSNVDELFGIPKTVNFSSPISYRTVGITSTGPSLVTELLLQMKDGNITKEDSISELPPLTWQSSKFLRQDKIVFNCELMVLAPSKKLFHELMTNYKRKSSTSWFSLNVEDDSDYLNVPIGHIVINEVVFHHLRRNANKNVHTDTFTAISLPYKKYGLLSSEFRSARHSAYTLQHNNYDGNNNNKNDYDDKEEEWNALNAISAAKVVHYSDEPIPAPWQPYDNSAPYNAHLMYCFNSSFDAGNFNILFPTNAKPMLTRDCDSVRVWDWLREQWALATKDSDSDNHGPHTWFL